MCILDQDTAINQDLKALIPKNDDVDKKYLFYWYQSVSDQVEKDGVGLTVKGVKVNYLQALQFPFPPSPPNAKS